MLKLQDKVVTLIEHDYVTYGLFDLIRYSQNPGEDRSLQESSEFYL